MMTSLPGLALGAWELNDDMIAQLHRGEAVIPTSFANGLRNSLANGPVASGPTITYGETHLHVSAIAVKAPAQRATVTGNCAAPCAEAVTFHLSGGSQRSLSTNTATRGT
jgi:hypothetical protein